MGSVEQYRGRDVFIVGKKNSAFEISNGLLPWARSIILASPSPARLFIETHSLAGVRARYSQPFEDDLVAGAVNVLSVAVDEVSREGDHYRIHMHGAEDARELVVTADDVICATGFETPLLDLPQMGVETVGQSRLPVMTPYWESVSSPGLHFAGTISQGAVGLKKHGVPSNSGAVQGHRYNARVLARHLAEVHFDAATDDLVVGPEEVVDLALREAHHAPELWHQKAYLARVLEARDGGMADRGVRPLAAFVDESGPDAVAVTLEANARGEIYPVVYTRRANRLEEHVLPGHLLHDFETEEHRLALSSALRPLLGAAVASH